MKQAFILSMLRSLNVYLFTNRVRRMPKKSGWVIAATEGATVDGRAITASWIKDMAEQYSLEEYTALIWPEHFRSSWAPYDGKNWGTVDEVKAEKYKGKLRLYVKITANDYLLEANNDGQKLFMSIEPNPDYKGQGKCYLMGLAVTDSPASSGTSRLKFSIGDQDKDYEYSGLEPLLAADLFSTEPQPNPQGFVAALTELAAKFGFTPNSNTPENDESTEDEEMKEEQFNALMKKIGGIETKVNDLEGKVENFNKPENEPEPQPEPEPEVKDEGISSEQFSKLETAITGLTTKVDGIEGKFKELSKEVGGQEPDPVGDESISIV